MWHVCTPRCDPPTSWARCRLVACSASDRTHIRNRDLRRRLFLGRAGFDPPRAGVISTRVGYTGGDDNATYRNHGTTPRRSRSFSTPSRSPTGTSWSSSSRSTTRRRSTARATTSARATARRSSTTSDEQRRIAEDTIADVEASGLWPGKVVTEVAPAGPFWEAEPEHQDYLERFPNGYTCHFPRPGWKLPHRETAV